MHDRNRKWEGREQWVGVWWCQEVRKRGGQHGRGFVRNRTFTLEAGEVANGATAPLPLPPLPTPHHSSLIIRHVHTCCHLAPVKPTWTLACFRPPPCFTCDRLPCSYFHLFFSFWKRKEEKRKTIMVGKIGEGENWGGYFYG